MENFGFEFLGEFDVEMLKAFEFVEDGGEDELFQIQRALVHLTQYLTRQLITKPLPLLSLIIPTDLPIRQIDRLDLNELLIPDLQPVEHLVLN